MRGDPQQSRHDEAEVLTGAVLKAGSLLGLSQRELAAILGASPASFSRMAAGARKLRPESKEEELAILFLRIFRSLDALVGGSAGGSREWLRARNHHLGGVPLELMQSVRGLVEVADYLDGIRGFA